MFKLNGNILDLRTPKIMGIINLTPDSFYVPSRVQDEKAVMTTAERMLSEGADILDLGAFSSRPGAKIPDLKEELKRLGTIVSSIKKAFPDVFISVDCFREEVVKTVLDQGAHIINDIYASRNNNGIPRIISGFEAAYVCMHMKGDPTNMQDDTNYDNVINSITQFFVERLRFLHNEDLYNIIIDPGFGFGKSIEDNYKILNELHILQVFDKPILVGISRKSMIYKLLKVDPEESLNATSFLHYKALNQGAKILRVHDVKAAAQCVRLYKELI